MTNKIAKPSSKKRKLNWKRKYLEMRDLKHPNHRYIQDGSIYDHNGVEVAKTNVRIKGEGKKVAPPRALSEKDQIKAKAAAKLGTLETRSRTIGAPRVPKTIADAYKENRMAEAAEESAD
jgi:hypothetical protein